MQSPANNDPVASAAHLFQALLVVGRAVAVAEGAAQHIELLGVGIACAATQVAVALDSVYAVHACTSGAMQRYSASRDAASTHGVRLDPAATSAAWHLLTE